MHSDRKLAYIDLFAGPGRYEDGSASTPLMVLTEALKNPDLKEGLVSIFNDEDEKHTSTLETEIAKLPGIASLKHQPQIFKGAIDDSVAKYFDEIKLIPTFFFVDPFGYKGLSSALIRAVIKDWASECIFFFNYSRINAGVSNPLVLHHMQALFGEHNLAALQARLKSLSVNREKLILEHLTTAMIEAGAKFVLPFRFRNNKGTRKHNPGRMYIKNNYKVALDNLERSGRIKCNKPKRRVNTFADDILVTFPQKPVARK